MNPWLIFGIAAFAGTALYSAIFGDWDVKVGGPTFGSDRNKFQG